MENTNRLAMMPIKTTAPAGRLDLLGFFFDSNTILFEKSKFGYTLHKYYHPNKMVGAIITYPDRILIGGTLNVDEMLYVLKKYHKYVQSDDSTIIELRWISKNKTLERSIGTKDYYIRWLNKYR